jgi:multimeric flavodoxin WrbA
VNIVVINGSPRKNGATGKVLNRFSELLQNNYPDSVVHFYNLIDVNPKYCIGCETCYKTGMCIIKDDQVEEIHEKLKNCDGIIMGSPTYGGGISGLFKAFHDRVHMTMEQLFYKKPCITVTTYENAMGSKTIKIMKEIVNNTGGYNKGSMAIKCAFNQNPLDEKTAGKIETLTKQFAQNIASGKIPVFSKIYTMIAVKIIMGPFVYKSKERYKGIIESWIEKKIISPRGHSA